MIHVDLKSKVIGENQTVFMVRPGSNYKLYNLFTESQGIYADLLGLELQNGVPLDEQDRVLAQLHRARHLRAFRRSGEIEPSRDLDDYNQYKKNAAVSQLHRVLRGFFEIAKKGDIVLVPPRAFSQDALIGELTSDPSDLSTTRFPQLYGQERLYGRSVKWLGKVPKGKLSPYLLDLISKPNAFVELRLEERPAIYREAYGSYILPGEYRARFNVSDPDFTTTDDLYIQAFFSFVAANSKRIRENREVLPVHKAAFERLGDDAIDLQSNINSPGFLTLISKTTSPLVATALFLLAVSVGPDAVIAAEQGTILIGNSHDAGDPCTFEIHEEVLQHLRLLQVDKWAEACEIARVSEEATGLSGQGEVKIESDDG